MFEITFLGTSASAPSVHRGLSAQVVSHDEFRFLIPCELRPEPEPGEPFDGSNTVAGIFYDLMPAQHGKGYATEAAHALVANAFDALHLPRLTATTTADNQASIHVIRKLGMRIKFNDPEVDIFSAYMQVVGELVNPEVNVYLMSTT